MEELDLKELFTIFWNRKVEIILIVLIFMMLGIIYSYVFVIPKYSAYTTMLLTSFSDTSSTTATEASTLQTDLNLNSNLVYTYSELIKSKKVLREVEQNLKIENLTFEKLKNSIKVTAVEDTEIIQISVKRENPEEAVLIANETARVFSDKIVEIYEIKNINIIDEAEINEIAVNVNHIKDIIVFAFIGFVIASIYVLLYNLLDNTIKSEQDIEKIPGLIVLSVIPEQDFENKRGGSKK